MNPICLTREHMELLHLEYKNVSPINFSLVGFGFFLFGHLKNRKFVLENCKTDNKMLKNPVKLELYKTHSQKHILS